MKLRVGILGCGKVAHLHAKALSEIAPADFVAVWSRTEARRAEFAATYGVRHYAGIGQMVEKEKLDAVIVCTSHPHHVEPTVEAARAGAHVLVEKPLASTLEDCDVMIRECREHGRLLGTVSQRRWYAPVKRVKDAITDGKIGMPILGMVHMLGWRDRAYYESDQWRGTWRSEGGGVLVNQAPHQLDILQWYMGPVREVSGFWANLNHPYIEVEDTAVAVLQFESGALGNIIVSNSQNPALFGRVWVHGANGATVGVQTDGGAMFIAGMTGITEPPVNDRWTVPGEEDLLAAWQREDAEFFNSISATDYYHRLQIEDFLDAIAQGGTPAVTGEDGRKSVEIFTAIYRSQRDRSPVRFPLSAESERDDMDGRLARP